MSEERGRLIGAFLARYRKEYDFYDQAARLVARTLEAHLQAAGIRSMVTARAKSPVRLEAKCRQREAEKDYSNVDEIYGDIVDLAGARVALYFPGERVQVDKLVRQQFVLLQPAKEFPGNAPPACSKKFSGYGATHYRVRLKESSLSEAQRRYAEAPVEIQVLGRRRSAWRIMTSLRWGRAASCPRRRR